MHKAWLWTMLAVAMVVLFVGGLTIGLGVNGPDASALRAETDQQQAELTSMQTRLSLQDAEIEYLGSRLGDVEADRAGLAESLNASNDTVSALEVETARLTSDLDIVTAQLAWTQDDLTGAQDRGASLQTRVAELLEAQRRISQSFELLTELQQLQLDTFGPNHGDALLLVEEAHRAAGNNNLEESARFFGEASRAFDTASDNAAALSAVSLELSEAVPEDVKQTYIESYRRARSTVFAMDAEARTYEAADLLYAIIAEWSATEAPTAADRLRWGESADLAEEQFILAMEALDEADTWGPGLWRRTEAIRLNTRDWRNLLLAIRFNVIDVRDAPPGAPDGGDGGGQSDNGAGNDNGDGATTQSGEDNGQQSGGAAG